MYNGRANGEQQQEAGDLSHLLDGIRVLIVDDNPDLRFLLAFQMRDYGADAITAGSAAAAMQIFAERPPDVMIADIDMPVEDGYTLIRRIRKLDPNEGSMVPAIALTGHSRRFSSENSLDAGYQVHLIKPADPDGLAKVIAELAGPKLSR